MRSHYTDDIYNNYLMHYGVVGVKWGVKRGRRIGEQAAALQKKANLLKSQGKTKKAQKLSAKASAKRAQNKRIMAKHNRLAGKKVMDKVEKQSWGKTITKTALMGSYGSFKYDQLRTQGVSKGKAAVAGVLSGSLNRMSGGIVSVVEPRATGAAKKNMTKSQKQAVKNAQKEVATKKKELINKAKKARQKLSY